VTIDADTFRDLFGAVPSAVGIVTTLDHEAAPHGLTCTAVCPVSLAPPLLLVCVDRSARTLPVLRASAGFVVIFLAAGSHGLSEFFAGKQSDLFREVRWEPAAAAGGAPVLVDHVVAHAECRITDQIEAGDHWVLIARVESASVRERQPLLYRRRRYASWPAVPAAARAE
jgi:flavin reductase (DIM6/NTAB) family NADH-FMN oxidoreductase RutF